jgi:DNA-binding transcriptional LysR family regulator
MTYEQILVLHAIVSEGTFRAAAERLNKSQSAVSHMLKKLETEIDIQLFSREAYRPKLTSAGKVFYRQATRVMQQMQQLKGTAKKLNAGQEAEVFLAVAATYPMKELLKLLSKVMKTYPSTHIRLSTETMGGPIERLLKDDADIVVTTIDDVPADQVEAIPFSKVMIIPVSHSDYEPAQSSHMKTISEMQSHVQVIVSGTGSSEFSQSRDLLPGGLRWTVSDFATKKEVILAKMGWGGLPEHLIKRELDKGLLVPLNVEGYPPRESHLYQIRHRDREVGIVAQSIWKQLEELD